MLDGHEVVLTGAPLASSIGYLSSRPLAPTIGYLSGPPLVSSGGDSSSTAAITMPRSLVYKQCLTHATALTLHRRAVVRAANHRRTGSDISRRAGGAIYRCADDAIYLCASGAIHP